MASNIERTARCFSSPWGSGARHGSNRLEHGEAGLEALEVDRLARLASTRRSSGSAASTALRSASTRPGRSLAATVSRAAVFTGGPITVNSSRVSVPTWPATTSPRRDADAGVEVGVGVSQLGRRDAAMARLVAQRPGGVVGLVDERAEHAQGAVALEVVDPPVLGVARVDDGGEEAVQQGDDLLGRQPAARSRSSARRSAKSADTHRTSPPSWTPCSSAWRHDRRADVAAEEVLELGPLAQPGDHLVDAGLELAELAGVVDDDGGRRGRRRSTCWSAWRTCASGCTIDLAVTTVVVSPATMPDGGEERHRPDGVELGVARRRAA